MNKEELYQEARALMLKWYGQQMIDTPGACLYWTQVAMNILHRRGERVIFQAGTMLWPCLNDDHGDRPTHFGYEWTPDEPFSKQALAMGQLPEVHMWAALPDRGEIVDFSTAGFKRIAKEHHGLPWETPDPPLYIWGQPPERTLYKPIKEAIVFMLRWIVRKQLTDYQEHAHV